MKCGSHFTQFTTILSDKLLVTHSRLSNLPFEAYQLPEGYAQSELLPKHFACAPSFMFGSGYKPPDRHPDQERILIVGYDGADLPSAEEEATLLCSLFGDRAHYIVGRDCTKKRVIEELNGDYAYIHFICHGTYNPDHPRESSLYFSDSRTSDAFRLRASEIGQFARLQRKPVVTLSACSTALTADSRSNTWQGIPGSLLEVGARCIIGTRWPVADRAAGTLMYQMYSLLLSTNKTPLQCFHALQDKERGEVELQKWACFGYLGLP